MFILYIVILKNEKYNYIFTLQDSLKTLYDLIFSLIGGYSLPQVFHWNKTKYTINFSAFAHAVFSCLFSLLATYTYPQGSDLERQTNENLEQTSAMRREHHYKYSNMEKVTKGYNEQLYTRKFNKMDKFLGNHI